jgi:hypothetical protein
MDPPPHLRKLNKLEVRRQYQINIAKRSVTFKILNDREDITRAWENIQENIKPSSQDSLGLYKLGHHKPWF